MRRLRRVDSLGSHGVENDPAVVMSSWNQWLAAAIAKFVDLDFDGEGMDFRDCTLASLAAGIRAGDLSAEAVARSTLARIDALDGTLGAFVARCPDDEVVEAARAVDRCVARGQDPGALAGVPVAVKDLEDVRGLRTTYGSALYAHGDPAEGDSVLVERMRAAGALIVGKTNTPEFGCKGATDNPLFGPTHNPWSLEHSPGGSSGGSAAALAAGLVPLATGSDGGGSIRIPAARCGLSGFKATQGRVPLADATGPTTGLLAVRGPMARDLRDTVIALDAVRGDEPRDVFGLPDDDFSWLQAFEERRLPTHVLWAPTLGFADVHPEVRRVCEAALSQLDAAGVEVIETAGPFEQDPLDAWWTLWSAAMARKLGHYIDTPDFERIDPQLRQIVEDGMAVTGTEYARAIDACHDLNGALCTAFERAPCLLAPTCSGPVHPLHAAGSARGRDTAEWVEMTLPCNLTRNPAATVFAGVDASGLPVGLQVIGPPRADVATLCAAGAFEDVLGGPGRAPDLTA